MNRFITTISLFLLAGCHSGMMQPAEKSPKSHRRASFSASATPSEMADALSAENDGDTTAVSLLIINGDPITVDDVLKPVRHDLETRAGTMDPTQYRKHLTEMIEARVRRLARDVLLFQEASKDLTDQEWEAMEAFVDQRIRDRINREFDGRRSRYEAALKDEGSTIAEERERVRREMTIVRWIQLNVSGTVVDPTRDELAHVFELQKNELTKPPRRDLQLIEISVLGQLPKDVTAPDAHQLSLAREEARAKAERVRDEIINGGDFVGLAKQHSDGLRGRNGGRWGWVTRGGVRERWAKPVEALFALPSCNVPSDVIETPDAFFVVQAAEIDPGALPDFESVQPELIERFRELEFNRRIESQIGRLQAEAEILPKDIRRFFQAVANSAPQPPS